MRRPAGVIVAAIVLGLMALMGIFWSLVSLVVSFLVQNPAMPPVPGMRAVMAVTMVLMLCFFLYCGWTVVGLFRMRPWARYSILVIGGLEFSFSLLLCAAMILMRNMPPPMPPGGPPSPIGYHAIFLGMALFYGLLGLIGLWWLVYFNLPSVRAAFTASVSAAETMMASAQTEAAPIAALPQEATAGWRVVIIAWACLMLVGVLFFPMMLLTHLPLFMLGVIIRGAAATVVLLALVAVQLYMGVGLLKKWRPAWYVAMAWQVYTVAYFLILLMPAVWARFMAYERELMGQWGVGAHAGNVAMVIDPLPFMRIGMVAGLALVAVFTIALVRRRQDYLHA